MGKGEIVNVGYWLGRMLVKSWERGKVPNERERVIGSFGNPKKLIKPKKLIGISWCSGVF